VNTTTVTRSQVPPHSTTLTFLHLAHLSIRYDTIPPIPPTETQHAVIPLPSPSTKQTLTSYSRRPAVPPSLPQTLSQTQNPSHDTTCRLNPTAPPHNRNIDPTGKQTKKKGRNNVSGPSRDSSLTGLDWLIALCLLCFTRKGSWYIMRVIKCAAALAPILGERSETAGGKT